MKKKRIVVLGLAVALTVTACGKKTDENETGKAVVETVQETEKEKVPTGVPKPLKKGEKAKPLTEKEVDSLFLKEIAEDKESDTLVYDTKKEGTLSKEEKKLFHARRDDANRYFSSLTKFHVNKRPLTNFFVTEGEEKILFEKVGSEYIAYAKNVEMVATPRDGGGTAVYTTKDGNLYLVGYMGNGRLGSVLLDEGAGYSILDLQFQNNEVYYNRGGVVYSTEVNADAYRDLEEKAKLVDVLKTGKTNPVIERARGHGVMHFIYGGGVVVDTRADAYAYEKFLKSPVRDLSEPMGNLNKDLTSNVILEDMVTKGKVTYLEFDQQNTIVGELDLQYSERPLMDGGYWVKDDLRDRHVPVFIYTGDVKYESSTNVKVTYYRLKDNGMYEWVGDSQQKEYQKGDLILIELRPKVDDIHNILYDEHGNPEVVFYANGDNFESINLKSGARARKNPETGEFHEVKSKVRKVTVDNPIVADEQIEIEVVE